MRIAGSAGSEDRKKFIAVCVFALLAVSVLYYELRDPTPTAPPPPPVITTSPAQASVAPPTSVHGTHDSRRPQDRHHRRRTRSHTPRRTHAPHRVRRL